MSYIPNENRISTANSSTSTLTASSTFTGSWEDVTQFDSVVVATQTDQNGTITIEFSSNGSDIESTLVRYYRTSQIEAPHRFTITRQFVRVKFENTSTSGQTYFRLQTMYGDKSELNAPTDSVLAQDFDAIVVRPTDFRYEVGLNRRQGYTTWNKWGYNADIDSASAETIWSVGGTLDSLSSAETLEISSSSTNDTSAGTGARSVIIYGIDADSLSQIEVVTMNGTTDVTTSNSWLGINRISVYLVGALGYNDGVISAISSSSATTQAEIPTQEGSTQHAFFFTQANHTTLIDWLLLNIVKTSGGTKPIVTIRMYITSLVSGAIYEVFRHIIDVEVENTIQIKPSQPFIVGEKSLIEFTAETSANNTAVSCRFSLIEVRDVDA